MDETGVFWLTHQTNARGLWGGTEEGGGGGGGGFPALSAADVFSLISSAAVTQRSPPETMFSRAYRRFRLFPR